MGGCYYFLSEKEIDCGRAVLKMKGLFGGGGGGLSRGWGLSLGGSCRCIFFSLHTDSFTLASLFNNYFITKIADIRKEFSGLESDAAQMSMPDFNVHHSHTTLSNFTPTTIDEVQQLLSKMNKTTCTCMLDPFCTSIIMQHSLHFILYMYTLLVYVFQLVFSLQDLNQQL